MPYAEIIADLPTDLRSPMGRLVDALFGEFALKKTDFEELKAIVRDLEIKSALDKGALYQFARKVEFYAQKTGRQITRKLVVTPYAENRAKEAGVRLGIKICTDVNALN